MIFCNKFGSSEFFPDFDFFLGNFEKKQRGDPMDFRL